VIFLVVDDDENSRVMLTGLLEGHGFTVVSACNGREALEMAKDSPPDMIISDIMMPEMDGFTLCREIKNDSSLAHIPVIFYTATFGSPEDKKLAQSLGVSRFISKPMEAKNFSETIQQIIEEYQKGELPIPKSLKEPDKKLESMYEEVLSKKLQKKIVELEKEREALRKSEENLKLFRDLVNQSNDAIFVIDVKTARILDVNQKAWSNLGYTRDELLALKVTDIEAVTPDESSWHNLMKEIDSQGTMFLEGAHKRKDGRSFPVEVSTRNVVLKERNFNVAIVRDISKRKQAEEQIHKLSDAVEQSPVSILITDVSGTIEYVNPFFCQVTNYSAEEAIGQNPRILKSGEMPDEVYKVLWETILSGKTWRGELRNKKKSGELYWESAVISPILIDGKISHFIAIKEDITDKKEKEKMLAVAHKQLLISEKLAGIGELAAGVSHEVLNPVNIISVHIQMLQKKTLDDPKVQEFCSKVRREIDRVTKIMKTLLVFSRKGDSTCEKTTVKKLIEEVLDLVVKEFASENIAIETEFCDPIPEIFADKDKMRQVFLNLVHNARHAMPKGGTLTLKCQAKKSEGLNVARITISDTGTGISKKNLNKIFDPFFTTKPEGKGTGMGLSVVYGIIEEYDGKITVESEEGEGTTFIISLPIAK